MGAVNAAWLQITFVILSCQTGRRISRAMSGHLLALLALATAAWPQSQPVTGTNVRPGPQTPAAKPSAQTQRPAPPPRAKLPPPKASEEVTPLQAGTESYTFVKRVHQIFGPKELQDSTTEWWELRDAGGKVVKR